MKKLSNTVNHSNKLMLTYFFRAVFINLYFKTKHSNETFHLGFCSLLNVFSYRKHISSKIIASSTRFYYRPPSPFYGIVSIFPEGNFIMTPPPPSFLSILIHFPRTPIPCLFDPSPSTIKHRGVKASERRQWRRSGVFIVNFEHISHHVLVYLLLTLSN